MIEQTHFDAILMDIEMSEMDGFSATLTIRKKVVTGRHLPIVAMVAHAMNGDQERCLAASRDAYTSKPIQANHLFETIETLCSAGQQSRTD